MNMGKITIMTVYLLIFIYFLHEHGGIHHYDRVFFMFAEKNLRI